MRQTFSDLKQLSRVDSAYLVLRVYTPEVSKVICLKQILLGD